METDKNARSHPVPFNSETNLTINQTKPMQARDASRFLQVTG